MQKSWTFWREEADRGGQLWRIGALTLDTEEPIAAAEQKIDLRSLMCRPEPGFIMLR
jgi:hypothetical protein